MSVCDAGVVPLQQASLCLDCEQITAARVYCRACGSHALLGIAGVLSRSSSPILSMNSRWQETARRMGDRSLLATAKPAHSGVEATPKSWW